jgi:hypothetical protein
MWILTLRNEAKLPSVTLVNSFIRPGESGNVRKEIVLLKTRVTAAAAADPTE